MTKYGFAMKYLSERIVARLQMIFNMNFESRHVCGREFIIYLHHQTRFVKISVKILNEISKFIPTKAQKFLQPLFSLE